jgi:hypothetical protein
MVCGIYEQFKTILTNPSQHELENASIIAIPPFRQNDKDPLPVIYQPAIDKLNNFVHEIPCWKTHDKKGAFIEVLIMFNNEQLRRHKNVNGFL